MNQDALHALFRSTESSEVLHVFVRTDFMKYKPWKIFPNAYHASPNVKHAFSLRAFVFHVGQIWIDLLDKMKWVIKLVFAPQDFKD